MSDRTFAEAAEELNLPRSWLEKKVTARQIPHHRYGRHIRFTAEDIAAIRELNAAPVLVAPSRNVLQMRRRVA